MAENVGLKIVKGPSSSELAGKLSSILQVPAVGVEHKLFPDGESYIKFEDGVVGEDVVLVQGLHPPQDTNLTQLLLMADCLKDLGAVSIRAVVPYMAYARQDRRFREGEAVSILTLFKLLKAVGVDEVLTVNIHSPWVLRNAAVRVKNIDATGLLATYILQAGVEKPLILAPGKKGLEMAASAAYVMETSYGHIESRRDPVTGIVTVSTDADPKGRETVLLDDVISTGQTMVKCVQLLRNMGASRIIVACVHGLFVGSAYEKISAAGADLIITTDTVPNPYAVASVAGLLASQLG
ncbi:MAG: ribose-phosphate diphosphokinase [Candidatus Caldarchaeum sp.]